MHEAVRANGQPRIAELPANEERATFIVLHEGRIYFEGSAAELQASPDDFLREFLFLTLPPW
jgi:hypothetical protein